MIPLDWMPRARAPIGKILVRHKDPSEILHGLYVPHSTLKHTRTAVGVVVDIHPSCGELEYSKGDPVMLSPAGGQMIVFGLAAGQEHELWLYNPEAVRFVFESVSESAQADQEAESHLRHAQRLQAQMPTVDDRFVEGDPRGPR